MRILLVGYGKMGRLIEELAPAHGCEVAGRIDVDAGDWTVPADVAVDFSTADALRANFRRYAERQLPAVIGTTGWSSHEADLRLEAERADLGVVAAANFSIGVNLFQLMVAEASRLLGRRADVLRRSERGRCTALTMAAERGAADVIDALLERFDVPVEHGDVGPHA